jgi:hypothetical protein
MWTDAVANAQVISTDATGAPIQPVHPIFFVDPAPCLARRDLPLVRDKVAVMSYPAPDVIRSPSSPTTRLSPTRHLHAGKSPIVAASPQPHELVASLSEAIPPSHRFSELANRRRD